MDGDRSWENACRAVELSPDSKIRERSRDRAVISPAVLPSIVSPVPATDACRHACVTAAVVGPLLVRHPAETAGRTSPALSLYVRLRWRRPLLSFAAVAGGRRRLLVGVPLLTLLVAVATRRASVSLTRLHLGPRTRSCICHQTEVSLMLGSLNGHKRPVRQAPRLKQQVHLQLKGIQVHPRSGKFVDSALGGIDRDVRGTPPRKGRAGEGRRAELHRRACHWRARHGPGDRTNQERIGVFMTHYNSMIGRVHVRTLSGFKEWHPTIATHHRLGGHDPRGVGRVDAKPHEELHVQSEPRGAPRAPSCAIIQIVRQRRDVHADGRDVRQPRVGRITCGVP